MYVLRVVFMGVGRWSGVLTRVLINSAMELFRYNTRQTYVLAAT